MNRKIVLLSVLVLLLATGAILSSAAADSSRGVNGHYYFAAPPEWGANLDVLVDIDVREVNARTHKASGALRWAVLEVASGEWAEVAASAHCVLFGEDVDEDADTLIIVSRIKQSSGWSLAEPGQYAYWWLKDGGIGADKMAIRYYSFDPFQEFFPAGNPPPCDYFTGLEIDIICGDIAITR